jgi:hypothetical protein
LAAKPPRPTERERERVGESSAGKRLAGIEKMKGWWVLPISILSVASAAALLLGAEAQSVQQGHQAERISGEGPLLADLASDLR